MTHSRPGFACALALLWALGCALPAAASASELIVGRDPGLSAAQRAQVRSDAGVRLAQTLPVPNAEVVSVPDGRERAALATLKADPRVRYAVPDVPVHATAAASGKDLLGWDLVNDQWDADVDAEEAWDSSYEGQNVTVGVADMRINGAHPDLLGNVESEVNFVTDECKATAPPSGREDHGTHVAGIIAAQRNDTGIVGLAPLAHVKPLRTLDDCGGGRLSWVLKAFTTAGDLHLPIVVASFATDPLLPQADKAGIDAALSDALDHSSGTLFVVAAGNEGNNDDELPVYPCSNDAENLICVGMTDREDRAACWGNIGTGAVDLFAPGIDILSTVRGTPAYLTLSGTSTAAPLVAAAAALIKSQDQTTFDAAQLKEEILSGVDAIPYLDSLSQSGGRLNAARPLVNGGGLLKDGGPGADKPWKSCDPDHDGFPNVNPNGLTDPDGYHGVRDQCPDEPGTLSGCPDADGDGVGDTTDNCVHDPNPGQEDADADGVGDACDATPRGPDVDGDHRGLMDDKCPSEYAETDDGCPRDEPPPPPQPPETPRAPAPAPTPVATPVAFPAPRIVSVAVKVSPRRCRAGHSCKQSAKVTVKLTRTAKVALRVERRVRSHGRWVWRRVTLRSLTATASGKSLTVRGTRGKTLKKGSYRVIATVAGAGETCRFKV